ncbi:MAG: CDP-diacylglycerol--glycerol-3-phosphate 3-phosphatidyltransferase [Halanaerobiales bacterium]|nr:CDP-diacylglycerol--glycerol-3-phosphate 3-phosphatidyltransferase [Halanaerobiales bacterium]
MIFNYPNMLTVVRLLLIPVYLYFFLKGEYIISGIIFSISGLTDFFDGYLARKYNMVTDLGRLLDPLADKLTLISILVVLIYMNVIPKIISITLLTREVFVLFGSGIMYLMGRDLIKPTLLGKSSVFLLYFAIAASLLDLTFIDMLLYYVVIPLNIISALDYIRNAYKSL